MVDSGATINLNKPDDGLELTGPGHKTVVVANGQLCKTTYEAMLPMTQLTDAAHVVHILSDLAKHSLLSIKVLTDNDL